MVNKVLVFLCMSSLLISSEDDSFSGSEISWEDVDIETIERRENALTLTQALQDPRITQEVQMAQEQKQEELLLEPPDITPTANPAKPSLVPVHVYIALPPKKNLSWFILCSWCTGRK